MRFAAFAAFCICVLASARVLAECEPSPRPGRPAPFVQPRGPTIGLALGSGSSHALTHIGVIEALEEAGVDVRVVSGTSAGAIVGALWASGLDGRQVERLALGQDWDNLAKFEASRDGLMENRGMGTQLETLFAGRPIETWPRRFGAVATNVTNGHARVLMSGSGATAIQASTAMPVIFRPVTVGSDRLVDGALVQPVPVEAARAMGADYVIAIDVAYRPYEEDPGGMVGLGFQAMHILVNSLSRREIADADLAISLDVHHLMPCGRAALIAAGHDAMTRALPGLQAGLARMAAARAAP